MPIRRYVIHLEIEGDFATLDWTQCDGTRGRLAFMKPEFPELWVLEPKNGQVLFVDNTSVRTNYFQCNGPHGVSLVRLSADGRKRVQGFIDFVTTLGLVEGPEHGEIRAKAQS